MALNVKWVFTNTLRQQCVNLRIVINWTEHVMLVSYSKDGI